MTTFLGVGWTLVFEMFFYITFAIVMFYQKNIYIFVGLVLFAFSSLSLFRPDNYSPLWYLADPIILEFYMGMIVGYFALNKRFLPTLLSVIAFSLSLAYLFLSDNILQLHRTIESGIPAAMLVWATISLEKYLQNRIPSQLMFLGAASYALYLFHPLIAPAAPVILKKLEVINFPASVLLSVAITIISASVIHYWFERPVTMLLRRR